MKKLLITESQFKKIISEQIDESIYHETFSSAVQHARRKAEERGFQIDEDDWWTQVNTGQGKPKEGETRRMTIGITKDGKPQKKALHIQVFNMGNSIKNNYELNYYIL